MPALSRRSFTTSLSCAAVAALSPAPARSAPPETSKGMTLIDLSSNENPYGPSPVAIRAMTAAQAVASR